MMNGSPPVVLFDGDCSFRNATVRWTIRRDPLARLRFAPLRSAAARRAIALADADTDLDALPYAPFIQTHREPVQFMGSWCSLVERIRANVSEPTRQRFWLPNS